MPRPINLRDYTLPETVGATKRVNHTNCPAGIDTRQRLYITRQKPSLYLGYCHNCGNAGVLRNVNGILRHARNLDGILMIKPEDDKPEAPPDDLVSIMHMPPSHGLEYARIWLDAHRVELLSSLARNHLFWSEKMQRVIVCTNDGYWTARDCTGKSALKWYTPANWKKPTFPDGAFHHDAGRVSSTVVITEDPISALRISQVFPSVRVYPLYGTNLSDSAAAALANDSMARDILVWMDKDEAGIAGAAKVFTKLSLVADMRVKIRNPTGEVEEPKKCDTETIKRVVETYGR